MGVLISIKFANRVAATTKEIKDSVYMISTDEFPDPMIVYSEDEIGQIKESFNVFVEIIKEASDFITVSGKRELDKPYKAEFNAIIQNDSL